MTANAAAAKHTRSFLVFSSCAFWHCAQNGDLWAVQQFVGVSAWLTFGHTLALVCIAAQPLVENFAIGAVKRHGYCAKQRLAAWRDVGFLHKFAAIDCAV